MDKDKNLPEFLTLKEVVFYSRLSRTTIWKAYAVRGSLKKCQNTGRRVLIHRDDFLSFMGVTNNYQTV
jgi:hypothetical protein